MITATTHRRRRWLARLAAVAVGAVLLLALSADLHRGVFGSPIAPWTITSALAPLTLASLGVARRWRTPRALAIAGGIAGAWSLACTIAMHLAARQPGATVDRADAYTLAETVALAVVLVVTVRYGAATPTVAAAALLCAAVVLRPVAVGVKENSLLVALLCSFAVFAALVAALAARLVAADRRHHAEQVRLEQRLQFARDLHDFVAHHVTGIVVQAQGAQVVASSRPERTAEALRRIEHAGAEALRALRHMVSDLRTVDAGASPEGAGTSPEGMEDLRDLVTGFRLPGGATPRLVEEGRVDALPGQVTAILHRVVMESLTNVRKHAPAAREVLVSVVVRRDVVELEIVNDQAEPHGTGPDATGHGGTEHAGFGLLGLAERVVAGGGALDAGPAGRGRWRVAARVPVPTRAPGSTAIRSVA